MKNTTAVASPVRHSIARLLACSAALGVGSVQAQPLVGPDIILQPTNAVEDNFFGSALQIDNGKLFVSAPGVENGGTSGTGAVYVFDLATLAQESIITATSTPPELPPFLFGRSLSVKDGHMVVGSGENSNESPDLRGAAYFFEYPSGNQVARCTQTILLSTQTSKDFGRAVTQVGDLAIVSDPLCMWSSNGDVRGTVNFYDFSTGQQLDRLDARNTADYNAVTHNFFGDSLATWNDKLIVGFDIAPNIGVYDTTTRELLYKITPTGEKLHTGETGLAVYGDTLVVSDSAFDDLRTTVQYTAVYVIDLNTSEVVRTITFTPDNGFVGLGEVVAVNDRYLLTTRRDMFPSLAYRVLVYDLATGMRIGELMAPTSGSGNGFATHILLDGDLAYVTNEEVDVLPQPGGAVLIYDLSKLGTTCPADTNGDGILSPADFNAWIAAFNASAPECDQNYDGLCTPADFTGWIANYNAGC